MKFKAWLSPGCEKNKLQTNSTAAYKVAAGPSGTTTAFEATTRTTLRPKFSTESHKINFKVKKNKTNE